MSMRGLLALTLWLVGALVSCSGLSACAQPTEDAWRSPAAENLVVFQLSTGRVLVELAPFAAPAHADQVRRLVQAGFYDGLDFYRVIENFVAQAGDISESREVEGAVPAPLPMETLLPAEAGYRFVPAETRSMFAPVDGFIDGFAAGHNPDANEFWLIHCPGVLAMARNEEPDSGSTDFYIPIGQAPRHLDRNMAVFGRVLAGMDAVQKVNRGDRAVGNGVIAEESRRSRIIYARLVSDLPEDERPRVRIRNTESPAFANQIAGQRNRTGAFFFNTPPAVVDVCTSIVPVEIENF